jgi:predicted component of type VI protein secretion system
LELAGRDPKTRDEARLLAAMGQAAAARDPVLRQRAAQALADCGLPAADEVLLGLFHDPGVGGARGPRWARTRSG